MSVTIQTSFSDGVPSTGVMVGVLSGKLKPVAGVVVTGAGDGTPIPFHDSPAPTNFEGALPTEAREIDLSVTSPLGSRTGMRFVCPSPTMVTYEPSITLAMPTTAHWSPAGEPRISVWFGVRRDTDLGPGLDLIGPTDIGAMTIPASAFPVPGTYHVLLVRKRHWEPAGIIADCDSVDDRTLILP